MYYNNIEMSKLITLNGQNDKVLDDIFSNDIIVYEDVQGSKIWVNWDGQSFIIKPKSISNEAINLVDLAMQNYYNSSIKYFNLLFYIKKHMFCNFFRKRII